MAICVSGYPSSMHASWLHTSCACVSSSGCACPGLSELDVAFLQGGWPPALATANVRHSLWCTSCCNQLMLLISHAIVMTRRTHVSYALQHSSERRGLQSLPLAACQDS